MTAYEFTLGIGVACHVSTTRGLLVHLPHHPKPPADRHHAQCHRWSELSSALIEKWQLNEMHQTQAQSPATWQMKHTAAASSGTGRVKCTDLVRSSRAVETRRLFSFLQSSPSPLLLSLSSSLLSLCLYVWVCVYTCVCMCVWVSECKCMWVSSSLPFCLSAAQLRQFSGNEWERTENCCTCKWLTPSHMIR